MTETGKRPAAEDPLERFFAAERTRPDAPDPAFLSRVLADAEAETARRRDSAGRARQGETGWRALVGGWRGVAGLTATALCGIWIGASGPSLLDGVVSGDADAVAEIDALYLAFSDPYDRIDPAEEL